MKTGDLYWVNLEPAITDEAGQRRPVVVLNPGHAKYLQLAIVAPVTDWREGWKKNPFFVALEPTPDNGLEKKSAVDCFQIRAVSHESLPEKLGAVSEAEIDQIKSAAALILDIDQEHCL